MLRLEDHGLFFSFLFFQFFVVSAVLNYLFRRFLEELLSSSNLGNSVELVASTCIDKAYNQHCSGSWQKQESDPFVKWDNLSSPNPTHHP